MTELAVSAIAIGLWLVRLGWSGRRVSALAGWTIVVAGLTGLTVRHGAWGLAIGTVAAIIAALVMVLHAGWTSPPKPRRPEREPVSTTIPRARTDLARRLAVFALVVPIAFAAAQWLAFAAQVLARRSGFADADSTVLMLFLQPVVWGILMTVQMTRATATRMIAPPVVAGALGAVLWAAS